MIRLSFKRCEPVEGSSDQLFPRLRGSRSTGSPDRLVVCFLKDALRRKPVMQWNRNFPFVTFLRM